MIHPLIEQMAERFVHEVHDVALRSHAHDFFGRHPGGGQAP